MATVTENKSMTTLFEVTKESDKQNLVKELVARRKSTARYGQAGYYEFRGMPACGFATPVYRMEAAVNYDNFRPDDVFVLTYPKAGTHFVADVVQCIYLESKGLERQADSADTPMSIGMFELQPFSLPEDPMADLEARTSPRQLGSHLRWSLLPSAVKEGKVKTIHVTRNPVDSMCSAYPFLKRMEALTADCSWEEYFEYFLKGKVPFGGYFDWMRDFYPHRNQENILTLCYETMREDLASCIHKICNFLDLTLTEEQVERIVFENNFENKKKIATGRQKVFLRQGSVGGWRQELTDAQAERVQSWIDQGMANLEELPVRFT